MTKREEELHAEIDRLKARVDLIEKEAEVSLHNYNVLFRLWADLHKAASRVINARCCSGCLKKSNWGALADAIEGIEAVLRRTVDEEKQEARP